MKDCKHIFHRVYSLTWLKAAVRYAKIEVQNGKAQRRLAGRRLFRPKRDGMGDRPTDQTPTRSWTKFPSLPPSLPPKLQTCKLPCGSGAATPPRAQRAWYGNLGAIWHWQVGIGTRGCTPTSLGTLGVGYRWFECNHTGMAKVPPRPFYCKRFCKQARTHTRMQAYRRGNLSGVRIRCREMLRDGVEAWRILSWLMEIRGGEASLLPSRRFPAW
ncbi:hypothetical protein BDP55DRAFT_322019 [Colletotrichum godetiae]|uniref:Uncharacterized protein n=1 Tax=Colletotrichum godetiae TaxID=1209918 RepID=A0AAJ0ER28_9PEZI|nr:uncharacterized protein BDP55DRAFT_322019 [Colletotrichum godetiae]KAK1660122.1 hypothetical protein BDP55DRAFT_322019 [Colletotrichum godetiae]